MPARLQVELAADPKAAAQRPPVRVRRRDEPMRLLLLGNLAGMRRDRPRLAERPTVRVDLDTLDAALQRIAPTLELDLGGERCRFAPRTIDDFRPESLLVSLPPLARAWEARQRLADPRQFDQVAGELMGSLLGRTPPAPAGSAAAARSAAAAASSASPASSATAAAPDAAAAIDALIRSVVAPHVQPAAPAAQPTLVAAAEDALARQLRGVLHDPVFQALEAAWRGVDWLLSSLELDEMLQLHLFDVTRQEMLADVVGAQGHIEQTGLHRALADRWRNVPGGEPWSALIGLETFGPSDVDIGLLAALGIVASQAGGPYLGGAQPALAPEDDSALAGWRALRGSEAAPWLGLVAPRLLLRPPYGARSDRVQAFAFEELGDRPSNDEYLWGSGALAAALLLGRRFRAVRDGGIAAADDATIDGLPACTRLGEDGEPELVPCGEAYFGEARVDQMLQAGLMPLLSSRHRNAVRLPRLQSVATPLAPLAGFAA